MRHAGDTRRSGFPADFVWGAASSAYQIEGGSERALRGACVWDEFCRREGAVNGDHTGDVACDHYHRYREDVRLMQQIGLQAYRLSVAWPRVLPEGVGPVNAIGCDFYDRLVDALLEAGIEPWVTLFHWELPEALQRRGGWLNREIVDWFAAYVSRVVARLSDRVTHWMTINEPQIFLGLGLGEGTHAPGLKLLLRERLLAAHHALLAHGRGVQAIRAAARRPCSVGWASAVRVEYPASETPADIAVARTATTAVLKPDLWNTTWFADPIFLGRYPDDGLRLFGHDVPAVTSGDLQTIAQPIDFFGVNIYSGSPATAGPDGGLNIEAHPLGGPRNSLNWPVAPAALRWGPRFLWEHYRVPIVVAENGFANLDWVDLDGRVRDPQRIDYIRRYLIELERAIADGVAVRGYFYWSILDNFEWAEGFKERFGLIYVDYATQRRTIKESGRWYRAMIASNGAALSFPPETSAQDDAVRVAVLDAHILDPLPDPSGVSVPAQGR